MADRKAALEPDLEQAHGHLITQAGGRSFALAEFAEDVEEGRLHVGS